MQNRKKFSQALAPLIIWTAGLLACCPFVFADDTQLKVGDTINIVVFNEPSISGSFIVGFEGAINFPLLEQIDVEGVSVRELAKLIEQGLEADYIRDAQVSVDLVGREKSTVTVIGFVLRPGVIPYDPETTRMNLYTAIASAGGIAEEERLSRIEVKRPKGDSFETYELNYDRDKNFLLKDKDTVVIEQMKGDERNERMVTMTGQVRGPGMVEIPVNRDLDLVEALALSGGTTELAQLRKVKVTRNGTTREVNVSKMQTGEEEPLTLEAGDTIFVPQRRF